MSAPGYRDRYAALLGMVKSRPAARDAITAALNEMGRADYHDLAPVWRAVAADLTRENQ